jgi:hypothetical protein
MWKREGTLKSIISSMILLEAGPACYLAWISQCNRSRVISKNTLPWGFINPSYANLLWSAVLFQDINYWSSCGQQREE